MFVTDENLRNGPPPRARDHVLAQLAILVDIDFREFDAFLGEQSARPLAVRTPPGDVQANRRGAHLDLAFPPPPLMTGRLSLIHAFKPPSRLNTFVNPSFASVRAAPAPFAPLSQ